VSSAIGGDHRFEDLRLRGDVDPAVRQLSEQLLRSQPGVDRIIGGGGAATDIRDPQITIGMQAKIPCGRDRRRYQRHEVRSQL